MESKLAATQTGKLEFQADTGWEGSRGKWPQEVFRALMGTRSLEEELFPAHGGLSELEKNAGSLDNPKLSTH